MVRHRVRIARIIAAILFFALSTQLVEAQVGSCIISGTHASDVHAGMMPPQHHAHDAGAAATGNNDSDNRSSGTAACSQTMLCANVGAVPTTAMRAFHVYNAAPEISSGTGLLEARTLRPDPPPPRN